MVKPVQTILTVMGPSGASRKAQFLTFDSGSDMARYALETGSYRGNGDGRSNSWSDVSGKQACEYARDGNLDAARESDEMLSRFESFAPVRQAWESIDSVVGASPNVPNYISGNPMNMRLRHRTTRETAPLAIIVDSTSSGGINARDVNKRGSAILAFVRSIAARRPTELWVFCGLGVGGGVSATYCGHRIETSPMDLSHAAPCLASVAWSRQVGYRICDKHGSNGSWPFNHAGPLSQTQMESVFARALPHLSETLCIPGIYLLDELTTDPAAWIARNLARYSGETE